LPGRAVDWGCTRCSRAYTSGATIAVLRTFTSQTPVPRGRMVHDGTDISRRPDRRTTLGHDRDDTQVTPAAHRAVCAGPRPPSAASCSFKKRLSACLAPVDRSLTCTPTTRRSVRRRRPRRGSGVRWRAGPVRRFVAGPSSLPRMKKGERWPFRIQMLPCWAGRRPAEGARKPAGASAPRDLRAASASCTLEGCCRGA